MPALYRRSIRTKLILLFTATASLTVLIACSSLWIYQLLNYRATLLVEETSAAHLIAESSSPALLFNDDAAANETLSMLRADTRIKMACLYDQSGKIMASFYPPNAAEKCPEAQKLKARFTRRHLTLVQPIAVKGEPVGTLYVQVDLSEMYGLLLHLAAAGLCVLLATTIIALGLSFLLEGFISRPILDLTWVAARVAEGNNYSLRAEHKSEDETGILIDRFNSMMDSIQERDADLQQARAGLEERVEERTQDLRSEIAERTIIERDLEAARVLAEESNVAKSSFLATMSHELRTPLNAIIGYSEMLYEDAEIAGAENTIRDLDRVLLSARHLLSLISDILDFSKIEAGKMKIYTEPAITTDILRDLVFTAEVLAKANQNKFLVVEPVWSGVMHVDILRFRQSMLNLISNACKFTQNGLISLSVERRYKDDQFWIVWGVRDTGIGISPEDCKKLFHIFTQVDSSASRRHSGSGLGLAISRQLCEAMGGHIQIESEVNSGSIFSIYMPDQTSLVASRSISLT